MQFLIFSPKKLPEVLSKDLKESKVVSVVTCQGNVLISLDEQSFHLTLIYE